MKKKQNYLKKFEFESTKNKEFEILSDENINKILYFYDNRKDTVRNKAVFLLCLSFGLERSTLLNLTYDCIKKDKLILRDRELTLPPRLLTLLEQLMREKQHKKNKDNYVFYTKYKNNFKPLSSSSINYIFNILEEINKNDPNWKKLNPAYVRAYLIKQLFKNNFSLEEIVYITGADLLSISQLIPYDDIVNQVKSRGKKPNKAHPFHKFLY